MNTVVIQDRRSASMNNAQALRRPLQRFRVLAAVSVVGILACGCGDLYNTRAPAEADENAKRFEAEAGSSVIYVYRDNSLVAAIQAFRVLFDDEVVADFTQGRFVRLVASPGSHEVLARTISDSSNRDVLVLDTDPGEVYYVELEIGEGAVSGVPSLRVVEEQSAQSRIQRGALIKRGLAVR